MPVIEDNATTQTDNGSTQQTQQTQQTNQQTSTGGWKTSIRTDLRDSALLSKFEDSSKGLEQALESYGNLEKLLGRDKIPVPKDDNDTEAWQIFNKAMGVPEKPEGYGLADAALPENMKDITLDKKMFSEVMLQNRVPAKAVKGIWDSYQKANINFFQQAQQKLQEQLTKSINSLKQEWGDAFNINVELGQQVINRFSADKDENDFLTAVLTKHPAGIKFLARVGDQFAENKIPEFQMKKFTMSPESAQEQITALKKDLDGPYHNSKGKFTEREHRAAVEQVNMLYAVIERGRQA